MAFCSKCGTKITSNAKFCPSCGAAVSANQHVTGHQTHQQTVQPMTDINNMGKLLISTKTEAGMKTIQLVCCILEFIMGVVMLFNLNLIQEAFEDLLGSGTVGVVLCLVVGFMCIIYPILVIIGNRSYCDVYERGITGTTGLSLSHPDAPMQKFRITYDEIVNVTESGKTLFIYTKYSTYEILAMENRTEAVTEIRNRMSGIAK